MPSHLIAPPTTRKEGWSNKEHVSPPEHQSFVWDAWKTQQLFRSEKDFRWKILENPPQAQPPRMQKKS